MIQGEAGLRAEPAASRLKNWRRGRKLSGLERSDKNKRPGTPLHTH